MGRRLRYEASLAILASLCSCHLPHARRIVLSTSTAKNVNDAPEMLAGNTSNTSHLGSESVFGDFAGKQGLEIDPLRQKNAKDVERNKEEHGYQTRVRPNPAKEHHQRHRQKRKRSNQKKHKEKDEDEGKKKANASGGACADRPHSEWPINLKPVLQTCADLKRLGGCSDEGAVIYCPKTCDKCTLALGGLGAGTLPERDVGVSTDRDDGLPEEDEKDSSGKSGPPGLDGKMGGLEAAAGTKCEDLSRENWPPATPPWLKSCAHLKEAKACSDAGSAVYCAKTCDLCDKAALGSGSVMEASLGSNDMAGVRRATESLLVK